jgi:RNA polymerase sigma-70 factor (ECF subfamily)
LNTDSQLVAASLRGSKAAFGCLIDRHRPRLVALVSRLLNDADEAEDVAQEALLRAYLDLAQLRQPESFGSWACGIGLNVAQMRLRRAHGRRLALELESGGRQVPAGLDWLAPDPSPEQVVEAREAMRSVEAALVTLPENQRAAVLLHYLDGLSCQEIAALLGSSTGAVRVRLHRARALLRARLIDPAMASAGLAHSSATHEAPAAPAEELNMIEVELLDVVVRAQAGTGEAGVLQLADGLRVALLREKQGSRTLPIWIGHLEGDALAIELASRRSPEAPGFDVIMQMGQLPAGAPPAGARTWAMPLRPLSADLMARLLKATGGRVEQVAVSSLRDEVFYAVVSVSTPQGASHEIDARPSDALNLALRVDAPIFVAEAVMEQAGVLLPDVAARLDQESEKLPGEHTTEQPLEWRSLANRDLLELQHKRK